MSLPPWLQGQLQAIHALFRTNSAPLLIAGSDGLGLFELMRAYLAFQLCESNVKSHFQPCGTCAACAMVQTSNHPDCRTVVPQAEAVARNWPVDLKSGVKPSHEIRVDDVRELQSYFNTASSRGAERFVLIYPFDALNLNAANALLKSLEEPSHQLRFVLVGERLDSLLPTIRSRCSVYHAQRPSLAEASEWLAKLGVSQPELALTLAGMNPFLAQALALERTEELDLRKKWIDWLASPEQHGIWPNQVEKLGLQVLIDLALRLVHDLVAVAHQRPCEHFAWLAPRLLWARRIQLKTLSQVGHQLQTEMKDADHPLNPRLSLEFLAQSWQTLSA